MTAPARIKQADLKRLAAVAKSEGVRIKLEMDGMTIEITPDTPEDRPVAKKPIRL
jgi:hypothetical protein